MNKLYSTAGRLIGYNSDGINTADRKQLFNIDCDTIDIKLNALGVSEDDRGKYYSKTLQHYGMMQGLEIRNDIPYFKGTDVIWRYKPTSCILMFWKCTAQSLDLSLINTSKVTAMDCMFRGCKAQSLNLSSFNTSKVTDMTSMFEECKAQSLDLSSFDTSNVTNMNRMFMECEAKFLDVSSFGTSNVTTMNRMFEECEAQHIKINRQAFDKIYNHPEAFGDKVIMTRERFRSICEIV